MMGTRGGQELASSMSDAASKNMNVTITSLRLAGHCGEHIVAFMGGGV